MRTKYGSKYTFVYQVSALLFAYSVSLGIVDVLINLPDSDLSIGTL
jgi:hypothetical protein